MGFTPAPAPGVFRAFGHAGAFTPASSSAPPPATFDPATLAGNLLWLRGKDLGAAGSQVAAWSDRSGRGHDATGVVPAGLVVEDASTPAGGKALAVVGATSSLTLPRLDSQIVAVSASTQFGPEPASGGVDTGSNTFWTTNAVPTGWLQWQYAAPFVAGSYQITSRLINAGKRNPKDWTFEGSDDGATWTVLDTRAGITWSGSAVEVKTFPVAGAGAHKHYRLNVTANNGDGYLSVAEIFLPDAPGGVVHPVGAEAWVVVKADTSAKRALWSVGSGAQSFYPYQDGMVYETFGISSASTDRIVFPPTVDLGAWRLYRVANDGTTWQAWLDNASQATSPNRPVGWLWSGAELADSAANVRFQGGRIAELLIRDRVSTGSEAADLIAYFNAEHGLTVPTT